MAAPAVSRTEDQIEIRNVRRTVRYWVRVCVRECEKGEEWRKLYCLKFNRDYEVTGRKPRLSECLIVRQKSVKTHVYASLISKIFPWFFLWTPVKSEGSPGGKVEKSW